MFNEQQMRLCCCCGRLISILLCFIVYSLYYEEEEAWMQDEWLRASLDFGIWQLILADKSLKGKMTNYS